MKRYYRDETVNQAGGTTETTLKSFRVPMHTSWVYEFFGNAGNNPRLRVYIDRPGESPDMIFDTENKLDGVGDGFWLRLDANHVRRVMDFQTLQLGDSSQGSRWVSPASPSIAEALDSYVVRITAQSDAASSVSIYRVIGTVEGDPFITG